MTNPPVLVETDPLNLSVCKLGLYLGDKLLSNATGFFYTITKDNKPEMVMLVTNWHVLAGRHRDNPAQPLHKSGAIPNRIRVNLPLMTSSGEAIVFQEKFIGLYDGQNNANWYQHAQHRNKVDIGVINLRKEFADCRIIGVNESANAYDMAIRVGAEVFILGYPMGFTHFLEMPIWKRGSIASEPIYELPENFGRIVVDATTRQGMSGAPVILRANTHYLSGSGDVVCRPNAARFIGVYASRPTFPITPRPAPENEDYYEEDRSAEVGYVYKSGFVDDIITKGIRAPGYGDFPGPDASSVG